MYKATVSWSYAIIEDLLNLRLDSIEQGKTGSVPTRREGVSQISARASKWPQLQIAHPDPIPARRGPTRRPSDRGRSMRGARQLSRERRKTYAPLGQYRSGLAPCCIAP